MTKTEKIQEGIVHTDPILPKKYAEHAERNPSERDTGKKTLHAQSSMLW